jgi:hypothetical protein
VGAVIHTVFNRGSSKFAETSPPSARSARRGSSPVRQRREAHSWRADCISREPCISSQDECPTSRVSTLAESSGPIGLRHDGAGTQNNLGQRETGTVRLEEAVVARDACLTVTASVWPSEWVQDVRARRDEAQSEIKRRSSCET